MFHIGADIYTTDGRAGMLWKVVLDPATRDVTHLIVDRRFLRKPDRVVSHSAVARATPYRIRLNMSTAELEQQPQHGGSPFITEGMRVTDRNDQVIGTVQLVYPGGASAEAVERAQRAMEAVTHRHPAPEEAAEEHPATFAGDRLPPEMVGRMLRGGYLRIAGPGLTDVRCYVLPDQILGVVGDRVQLYVTHAELIAPGT